MSLARTSISAGSTNRRRSHIGQPSTSSVAMAKQQIKLSSPSSSPRSTTTRNLSEINLIGRATRSQRADVTITPVHATHAESRTTPGQGQGQGQGLKRSAPLGQSTAKSLRGPSAPATATATSIPLGESQSTKNKNEHIDQTTEFDMLNKCPVDKVPKELIGVIEIDGVLLYLIEWDSGDEKKSEPDRSLIKSHAFRTVYPDMVIAFYEAHINFATVPEKCEKQVGGTNPQVTPADKVN